MINFAYWCLSLGGIVVYLTFLAATLQSPRFSWPHPRIRGSYLAWDAASPTGLRYVPVLRPDWGEIASFFISWTTVLLTGLIAFFAGVALIHWGLATSVAFNPSYGLRGSEL